MTPEGHRAPLADLFRANRSVNSVNTQTPATDLPNSSYSSGKIFLIVTKLFLTRFCNRKIFFFF